MAVEKGGSFRTSGLRGLSFYPGVPALDGGTGHVTGAGVAARSPLLGPAIKAERGGGARPRAGGGDMSLEDPFFVVRG